MKKKFLLKAKIWFGSNFIKEDLQHLLDSAGYIVNVDNSFLIIYKEITE